MGEAKRRTVHAAVHGVTNAAADAGAIMAIGFAAFVATAKPPIPDDDLRRWRDAYFAGNHTALSAADVQGAVRLSDEVRAA